MSVKGEKILKKKLIEVTIFTTVLDNQTLINYEGMCCSAFYDLSLCHM